MIKLLIVDDEIMIRKGIKAALNWDAIGVDEVYDAASGSKALEMINSKSIDIMITDINMSEMTGLELIKQCKKEYPLLRIIVLSGYDDFEYARESLRLDVLDYLLKPIEESILTETIKKQVLFLKEYYKNEKMKDLIYRSKGSNFQIEVEEILTSILHNKKLSIKENEFISNEFNIAKNEIFQVAVLLMPVNNQKNENGHSLKNLVMQICYNHVDNRELGLCFFHKNSEIIIILFANKITTSINSFIQELRIEIIKKKINISKPYIGSSATSIDKIYLSYNEAIYPIKLKRTELRKKLNISQKSFYNENFDEILIQLKRDLCKSMFNENSGLIQFEKFIDFIIVFNIDDKDVRKICFQLICDVYYTYYQNKKYMYEGKLSEFMELLNGRNKNDCIEITRRTFRQIYDNSEGKDQSDRIREITIYIESNLDKDLGVSILAKKFNYATNYFSRLFKEKIGIGCNEYIIISRIKKAQSLLINTNFPTGKIALIVGYKDINYFSLSFKKYSGKSPTLFRKESRLS